jgi:hypothetical protein
MKGLSQDEHRGFNKYKLNYAYVNRADMYGEARTKEHQLAALMVTQVEIV